MQTARGDTAIGSSKALHPSDEGEGRGGEPRARRELCYGGRRGGFYLSCFCSVRAMGGWVVYQEQSVEGQWLACLPGL